MNRQSTMQDARKVQNVVGALQATSASGSGLPDPFMGAFALWTAGATTTAEIAALGGPPFNATSDVLGTQYQTLPASAFVAVPPGANNLAAFQITSDGANFYSIMGMPFAFPGRNVTFKTALSVTHAGTVFVGMSSLNPANFGAAPTPSPTTVDCFGVDIVGGNWHLVSSVGGVTSNVDTGIVANATRHEIEITLESGVLTCTIDGTVVVTKSTDIPVAPLGVYLYMPASAAEIVFESMYAENDAPTI